MEGNAVPETTSSSPSTSYQAFKRPQSLGKAINMTIRFLPQSPRKRQAVVSCLAKPFAVDIEKEMESLSTNGNALLEEVINMVSNYYRCVVHKARSER